MISASMPVSSRRRLGDIDHGAVGQHRDRRCLRAGSRPCPAAPCSGRPAPRPADGAPTASPAARDGRRTGRCRAAWARGRSPDRRPRWRRSAGPWRRRDWTARRSSGPQTWVNSASGLWLWVWPPKMPPPVGMRTTMRRDELAVGAVAQARRLRHDLVVGRIHVVGELDLDARPQPVGGHADGGADDARFVDRRVEARGCEPYFCCRPWVQRKTPPK